MANIILVSYDHGAFIHYFPLSLAYVATALRKAGHWVKIFPQDKFHYSDEHLTEYLDNSNIDVVGVGMCAGYVQYDKMKGIADAVSRAKTHHDLILGGHMVSADPKYFQQKMGASKVFVGEAENELQQVADWSKPEIIQGSPYDPDSSLPSWDLFDIGYYSLVRLPHAENSDRCFPVLSGRGCPFKCLQGDTLIDTLEGQIPIRQLVGRTDVKVLTRNPTTHEIEYAQALNISRTGKKQSLVRVHFDDGSFIDCTPDHKFMVFKNGNQFSDVLEWEVEAQQLQEGQSVRAVKYRSHSRFQYVEVEYGRHKQKKQHRLVMEGYLGRHLLKGEVVHHKDHDRTNNRIGNLTLTNVKGHYALHPEISLRMQKNNPMYRPEIKMKVSNTQKEMIRNGYIPYMCIDEGRKVIAGIARKRALSEQNPLRRLKGKTWEEFYGEEMAGRKRAKFHINHKVVRVERLQYMEDVYCMEVPGYDWFFANGVLVHNCSFCYRMHEGYRPRKIESIVEEICILKAKYRINYIDFADELLMATEERTIEMCKALKPLNVKWMCNGRLNYAKPLVIREMKQAGCQFINYGIESVNDDVLRKMQKALNYKQIVAGVEATLAEGVSPGLNMLWGNIGDTLKTLWDNVRFLQDYSDHTQMRTIRPVTPYPGTPLFDEAVKMGLVKNTKDFYECKHRATELLTVNFMDMSKHDAYTALFNANMSLIENHAQDFVDSWRIKMKKLYYENDTSFRGFRPL